MKPEPGSDDSPSPLPENNTPGQKQMNSPPNEKGPEAEAAEPVKTDNAHRKYNNPKPRSTRAHQERRPPWTQGFLKVIRGDEVLELIRRKNAFVLLFIIAYRAQRRNCFNQHNLKPGEALIGDHDKCGLTEREYRTAKAHLKNFGFATFRATSRGTVATLLGARIFDINMETADEQHDDRLATLRTNRRQARDDQATRTNNVKNSKNAKNAEESSTLPERWIDLE
jgi:hypothetical protein